MPTGALDLAIATEWIGLDASEPLKEMRKHTERSEFKLQGWSWYAIDKWLSTSTLDEQKLSRIRTWVDELKGNGPVAAP